LFFREIATIMPGIMAAHKKTAGARRSNDDTGHSGADRLARARAAFPVLERYCYLNTAAVGPVSTVYADLLVQGTAEDLAHGRVHGRRFERIDAARDSLRREIAGIVAADATEVVLTQRTSSGIRAVLELMRWQSGDEVVCTDLEHGTCRVPLEQAARRFGLTLRVAAVPRDGGASLDWLDGSLTKRTRMIVFSATTFETGLRLPARQIAELARARGALTLLDAAQAAGAVPLDLPALGVDFCALPLQKWLCGPEGLGALYLRPAAVEALHEHPGDRVVHGLAILEAMLGHLTWVREALGWDWIYARTARLAAQAQAELAALPRARLLTPPDQAGLTSVAFDGIRTAPVAEALRDRNVLVRHLDGHDAFRVATAYFNSTADICALVEQLEELTR
jgi:L-cysteine/cystine lyase